MGPLSLLSVLCSKYPALSRLQDSCFFWSYLLMWISYFLLESISREQWHQHYILFWICSPKRYIEIVTPQASGCDPIWKWGLCTCNQDQMRSSTWPLIQYDLCPCKKRRRKKVMWHGGGERLSDPAAGQRTARVSGNHQKARDVRQILL